MMLPDPFPLSISKVILALVPLHRPREEEVVEDFGQVRGVYGTPPLQLSLYVVKSGLFQSQGLQLEGC